MLQLRHALRVLGITLESNPSDVFRQLDLGRYQEDNVKEPGQTHRMFFEALIQKPTTQVHQGDPEKGHDLVQFYVNAIDVVFDLKPQPLMLVSAQPVQVLRLGPSRSEVNTSEF